MKEGQCTVRFVYNDRITEEEILKRIQDAMYFEFTTDPRVLILGREGKQEDGENEK